MELKRGEGKREGIRCFLVTKCPGGNELGRAWRAMSKWNEWYRNKVKSEFYCVSISIKAPPCSDLSPSTKINRIVTAIDGSSRIDLVLLRKSLMCIFILNLTKGTTIEMIGKWDLGLIWIFGPYEMNWLPFFLTVLERCTRKYSQQQHAKQTKQNYIMLAVNNCASSPTRGYKGGQFWNLPSVCFLNKVWERRWELYISNK